MKITDVPQSGKLGTFISVKNRFGQFRRRYVVPKDPRSAAQLRVRSGFGAVSARWRVLTDEQRAAWIEAGREVESQSRLGRSGPLTGCQLFVKINSNLAYVGAALVDEPPDYPQFKKNPVGDLMIAHTDGRVTLKLGVAAARTGCLLVWGTAPCSTGVTFPRRFVYLGLLPEPEGGVSDITALYVARYGQPPPRTRVFIQTCQQINGWQDAPKRTTAVVPAE